MSDIIYKTVNISSGNIERLIKQKGNMNQIRGMLTVIDIDNGQRVIRTLDSTQEYSLILQICFYATYDTSYSLGHKSQEFNTRLGIKMNHPSPLAESRKKRYIMYPE